MKSIMHQKNGTCFLCMLLKDDFSFKYTQEHHAIYGTAGRKLAEKYGLKVYLCLYHHTEGPESVHHNAKNSMILKQEAQRAFMKRYPELEWMKIFMKNYLTEEDDNGKEQSPEESHDERCPTAAGDEKTEGTQRETIRSSPEKRTEGSEPGFRFISEGVEDFDW